jgi:hypothetical protein
MARPKTDDDATRNLRPEDETQEAKEGTKIGLLPEDEVMADFRKIVGELRCHVCGEPIAGKPFVRATAEIDGERRPAAIHEDCL